MGDPGTVSLVERVEEAQQQHQEPHSVTSVAQSTQPTVLPFHSPRQQDSSASAPHAGVHQIMQFAQTGHQPAVMYYILPGSDTQSQPLMTSNMMSNVPYHGHPTTLPSPKKPRTRAPTKDRKRFPCEHCDRSFARHDRLVAHTVSKHTNSNANRCDECKKTFSRKDSLIAHQRIHSGDKKFKCDRCPRSFVRADRLLAHQRVHTGEKPFQCQHCEKVFSRKDRLRVHERTHTTDTSSAGSRDSKIRIPSSNSNHGPASSQYWSSNPLPYGTPFQQHHPQQSHPQHLQAPSQHAPHSSHHPTQPPHVLQHPPPQQQHHLQRQVSHPHHQPPHHHSHHHQPHPVPQTHAQHPNPALPAQNHQHHTQQVLNVLPPESQAHPSDLSVPVPIVATSQQWEANPTQAAASALLNVSNTRPPKF